MFVACKTYEPTNLDNRLLLNSYYLMLLFSDALGVEHVFFIHAAKDGNARTLRTIWSSHLYSNAPYIFLQSGTS